VLIAGFVIDGPAPKRLLVRAAGPALGEFGVVAALLDPAIVLHEQVAGVWQEVLRNDDWWNQPGASAVGDAMRAAGAFPLAPGAKDAAFVVTLEPGAYTATVSGVRGDRGIAIVEVYEL